MNRGRNKSAWIWVALAALTLASVARADEAQSARGYAHPVLQFLAGSHSAQPAALHAKARAGQYGATRQFRIDRQSVVAGSWLAMLPVSFVGLVSPLNQFASCSVLCLGGTPAAPLVPASFQRPPPFQFA